MSFSCFITSEKEVIVFTDCLFVGQFAGLCKNYTNQFSHCFGYLHQRADERHGYSPRALIVALNGDRFLDLLSRHYCEISQDLT